MGLTNLVIINYKIGQIQMIKVTDQLIISLSEVAIYFHIFVLSVEFLDPIHCHCFSTKFVKLEALA